MRIGGSGLFVLNLGTKRRQKVASFTPPAVLPREKCPWFPLNRRLCEPRSQYGNFGVKRNVLPVLGIEMLFFGFQAQKSTKNTEKFVLVKHSLTCMRMECPLRKG